jgi:hypothetical protein
MTAQRLSRGDGGQLIEPILTEDKLKGKDPLTRLCHRNVSRSWSRRTHGSWDKGLVWDPYLEILGGLYALSL